MLKKLIEIYNQKSFASVCDNKREVFSVREVYINPEHVVMIREEKRMKRLNEAGEVADGLDKNHKFSKITINRGQVGTEIIVVGSPEIIEKTLKDKNSKTLLRG